MIFNVEQIDLIVSLLKNKKIGVLPTDTIYGLHCLANEAELVEKIYELKNRSLDLPSITLISSDSQLNIFDVEIGEYEKGYMEEFWPGPNTLIFKLKSGGNRSFRLPDNQFLTEIVSQTGPLISTSANLHGGKLTENILQAQELFGDTVDFYVDAGTLKGSASTVYDLTKSPPVVLRG